jgi:hypothetical protein
MGYPTKMMHGEPKGLSQATVDGSWREVAESRELPHKLKWTLVGSEHDGFIGVIDKLSIVGIGGFLSRKIKFRLRKVARDCALSHDIGPDRVCNIILNCIR